MRRAMQKVSAYAMCFLLTMVVAGLFSSLYIQQLIISLGFLSPIFVSRLWRDELQFPALSRATPKDFWILLLFPLLLTVMQTVGAFSALFYALIGAPLPHPVYPQSALVAVILFAVLPALCEEFFSRYVILGTLLPYGRGVAIFVSALTFGLVHMNLYQIPYAFASGLVFGYVAIQGGSLLTPILFHFANNLISVIFVYAGVGDVGALVYSAVILILALILTPVYFYKKGTPAREEKQPFRMRELLLSPYLVFAVLTVGFAVFDLVVSIYAIK